MIKKLTKGLIKILIELSYWNAFFMKRKSEKEVTLWLGVLGIVVMLSINIMTVLGVVQIYTNCQAFDVFDAILPKNISQASNRWELMLYGGPLYVIITVFIVKIMLYTMPKEEIIKHFNHMSPKRQKIGKFLSILYLVVSISLGFLFACKMQDKSEKEQEAAKHHYTIKELGPIPKFGDSIH